MVVVDRHVVVKIFKNLKNLRVVDGGRRKNRPNKRRVKEIIRRQFPRLPDGRFPGKEMRASLGHEIGERRDRKDSFFTEKRALGVTRHPTVAPERGAELREAREVFRTWRDVGIFKNRRGVRDSEKRDSDEPLHEDAMLRL